MDSKIGSKWCYAEFESKEDADNYRFTHEQHALSYLRELVSMRQNFFCRIGLHSMREYRVKDGGGVIFHWGYCTKCHACHWLGKPIEGKRSIESQPWRLLLKVNGVSK